MIRRCTTPAEDSFQYYGARGISVCDLWRYGDGERGGFEHFIEHIGDRPGAGYSIDRLDTDGNYEPGNVKWATHSEQMRNRRHSVYVEFQGQTMHAIEACERAGIPYENFRQRTFTGWSPERALTTPVRQVKKRKASG